MLDAVSTGLHSSVVVSQLIAKYEISERALWSDWERRRGWVPFVLGLEKFAGLIKLPSKAYYRSFFGELDDAARRILTEYLTEFVEQPFVKVKTVAPELLGKCEKP